MNNPVCVQLSEVLFKTHTQYWCVLCVCSSVLGTAWCARSITLPQIIIVNLLAQMKVSRPRLHMTQLIVIITFINV